MSSRKSGAKQFSPFETDRVVNTSLPPVLDLVQAGGGGKPSHLAVVRLGTDR